MVDEDHVMTGVYALDAVQDDLERRTVALHLAGCAHCREEARSLRETAAMLAADAALTPPASLHDRVFEQIARTPQEPPLPVIHPAVAELSLARNARHDSGRGTGRGAGRATRWVAAAAAVVILGGGGLAAYGVVQLDRARQAQDQASRLQSQTDRVLAILGDPAARRATVTATGGGTATLYTSGSQAVLLAAGLPRLPNGRAYQLWVVRPNQVVSAGLAPSTAAGGQAWNQLVTGVGRGDAVAISVEPSTGSAQPTTTPVAVLKA